ncbi:TPA_asm: hypothetical protein HUJ06_000060 [Nelumbo nucifera]|uniref:Uncharacterized protein n=1 Tax=Nelumbo nucifera TaxID=4432 RepID=A0A823A2D7_NELNU|nr:TPA_asm: hypothetical protein HUJ06_000060 [Nelumbo nucifera]
MPGRMQWQRGRGGGSGCKVVETVAELEGSTTEMVTRSASEAGAIVEVDLEGSATEAGAVVEVVETMAKLEGSTTEAGAVAEVVKTVAELEGLAIEM